jgi:thiol-disulfide isomerase/thioredoxin
MKITKSTIFFIIVIVLVFGAIIAFMAKSPNPGSPGKYDALATCLKDKGAVFYGAFWCPHCQSEKKLFGTSEKLLPYVECSTPDGQGQTQICKDKKIEGYPTWEFADGSRQTGELSLQTLADKTACPLPQ